MTLKVVHIIDSGGFYGAEVMLLNLCCEQVDQGLMVEVISIGVTGEPAKELEKRLRSRKIEVIPWRMKPLPDPREALKIIRYCRSKNVDVIHSHGYKGNILLGILPRTLRHIPIVTTVHGYTQVKRLGKLYLYQLVDQLCLLRLDATVIVNESMRQQIPARFLSDRLYVVNNGLPAVSQIQQCSGYRSIFTAGDLKIGALGRLSHEKNFALAIESMARIISRFPKARLVIYGEGPLRQQLQKLIDEKNLSAHVELPGYLDDTLGFFSELDVFINCSYTEGMPISLLEAMRQGCRIVATDIPANRSLLQTVPCRTYLSPLNAAHLADAIITAVTESPGVIAEQKRCYQEAFSNMFTIQRMTKSYSDIYRRIKD